MTTLSRGVHGWTRAKHCLLSLKGSFKTLWYHLKEWIAVAVTHYRAAAAYEQLSQLSNAELHRRGLLRETLARDIVDAVAGHRFTEESRVTETEETRR
jgi:hypothetical protein